MPQIPRLGLAGITGIGQSSSATQNMFSRAGRSNGGTRRAKSKGTKSRKKKAVSASGTSRKSKSNGSKKGKYNSAAWMAKIRKMRKK